jgi:hypothetical protein
MCELKERTVCDKGVHGQIFVSIKIIIVPLSETGNIPYCIAFKLCQYMYRYYFNHFNITFFPQLTIHDILFLTVTYV